MLSLSASHPSIICCLITPYRYLSACHINIHRLRWREQRGPTQARRSNRHQNLEDRSGETNFWATEVKKRKKHYFSLFLQMYGCSRSSFFMPLPEVKPHGCRQKKEGEERLKGKEETPALAQWLQQHAVTICCSRWTRYPGNCIKAEGASPAESRGLFRRRSRLQQCTHHLLAGKITWPYSAKVFPAAPQRLLSGRLSSRVRTLPPGVWRGTLPRLFSAGRVSAHLE